MNAKPLSDLDKLIRHESNLELSASDVCKILRAAKEVSVVSLRFGNLEVQFADSDSKPEVRGPEKLFTKKDKQIPIPSEEELEKVEEDALLAETSALRQAQLDQMAIEHPEEYEKLMASGDLLDRKEEETSDSGP